MKQRERSRRIRKRHERKRQTLLRAIRKLLKRQRIHRKCYPVGGNPLPAIGELPT